MNFRSARRFFVSSFSKAVVFVFGVGKLQNAFAKNLVHADSPKAQPEQLNSFYANLIQEFESSRATQNLQSPFMAASPQDEWLKKITNENNIPDGERRYYSLFCVPDPECSDPKDDCWGPPGCNKK
jgi:hypothetical protein